MTAPLEVQARVAFLAFDVGCIECGEESAVVGLFATSDEAHAAAHEARKAQRADWHGQHYFEVHVVVLPDGV